MTTRPSPATCLALLLAVALSCAPSTRQPATPKDKDDYSLSCGASHRLPVSTKRDGHSSTVVYETSATTGSNVVHGTVVDHNGTPLEGVTITAISPSMQRPSAELSDATGRYRLSSLPTGTYTIIAFYADVEHTQANVAVDGRRAVKIDFSLDTRGAGQISMLQSRTRPIFETFLASIVTPSNILRPGVNFHVSAGLVDRSSRHLIKPHTASTPSRLARWPTFGTTKVSKVGRVLVCASPKTGCLW